MLAINIFSVKFLNEVHPSIFCCQEITLYGIAKCVIKKFNKFSILLNIIRNGECLN